MKRQDKELELELQHLAQAKISSQRRILQLQEDLAAMHIQVDLSKFTPDDDDDAHSVSTATGECCGLCSHNLYYYIETVKSFHAETRHFLSVLSYFTL